MGRIRTVKPEFFRHEELFDLEAAVGLPIRLGFIGLWTCCDREGRFKWRPRTLKAECLPHDSCDFGKILDALASRGMVVRYEVKGESYGYIPSWGKHQSINQREAASMLPAPGLTELAAPNPRSNAGLDYANDDGKDDNNANASSNTCEVQDDARTRTDACAHVHACASTWGKERKGKGKEGEKHARVRDPTSPIAGEPATAPVFDPSPPSAAAEQANSMVLTLYAAELERVYLAYPRQVGMGRAMEEIRAAVAHLRTGKDWPPMKPPEALELLFQKVSAFARSPAGNAGDYTPHPARWFREKRYLDDEKEWQRGIHQEHKDSNRGQVRFDAAIAALIRADAIDAALSDSKVAGRAGLDAGHRDGRRAAGCLLEGS